MKKTILYLIMILLSLSLVTASLSSLGIFKVNEDIEVIQVCSSCSYNNITSITSPNSSVIISNKAMTKTGIVYNYTLKGQPEIGRYTACGIGDLDGSNRVWCYDFEITQTGSNASTAQGLIYFILIAIAFIAFICIIAYGMYVNPSKYNHDTITGKIISVNYQKYIRYMCWVIAYALLVWITHLAKSIAENFLNSSFLSSFFNTIFIILLSMALPLFIISIGFILASIILDTKIKQLLNRGLQP